MAAGLTLPLCLVAIDLTLPKTVRPMSDNPDPIRRRFLAGVPLASVSLALGAGAAEAAVPAPLSVDPRQPQFVTTDHVATYYRLSRS